MSSPLPGLGLTTPVLASPMAGGPSTPELVMAAASVGGLGFLPAGLKTPQLLADEIAALRSAAVPFGVNVFVPNPVPVDIAEFRRYARALQSEAEAYGLDLTGTDPLEDDDHWDDKMSLLLTEPVPVVSFTFGVPDRAVVTALRAAGTLVVQTVTSADEARIADEAGADMLVVQSSAAGGHSGTLTPRRTPPPIPIDDLLRRVREAVALPMIAAGGLATPDDVTAAVRAGAVAVMVGTVLLRTAESGAPAIHRAALADPARDTTVVTHAFTGRPARSLRNRFTERFEAEAPYGYPAVNHLTSPLRKAAADAGDAELVHLWAGTGYRHATEEPAATVLTRLAERL